MAEGTEKYSYMNFSCFFLVIPKKVISCAPATPELHWNLTFPYWCWNTYKTTAKVCKTTRTDQQPQNGSKFPPYKISSCKEDQLIIQDWIAVERFSWKNANIVKKRHLGELLQITRSNTQSSGNTDLWQTVWSLYARHCQKTIHKLRRYWSLYSSFLWLHIFWQVKNILKHNWKFSKQRTIKHARLSAVLKSSSNSTFVSH